MWRPDMPPGGHAKGTAACLSGLFGAGRHDELLGLLELAPYKFWHDRKWGVKALVARGDRAAAIRYAEATRGLNQSDLQISEACEDILLSAGLWREAYDRYAIEANRRGTYLATFRAIQGKYPELEEASSCAIWRRARPAMKASGSPRPSRPGSTTRPSRWFDTAPAIRGR
ncbi:MAG: hypothetical protein HC871_13070 [Rhizobiales bacterium]|nr:hypothetical protein [Hyphomicrobiales bacterium]